MTDSNVQIDQDKFEAVLDDMREYYRAGNRKNYLGQNTKAYQEFIASLGTNVQDNEASTQKGPVPPVLNIVADNTKKSQFDITDRLKLLAQQAGDTAQQMPNSEEGVDWFDNAVDQLGEQAKEEVGREIDKTTAEIKAVGKQHPDQRRSILKGAEYLLGTYSDLTGIFDTAFQALKNVAQAIADKVVEVAKEVGNAFKSAYDDIRDWFSW